MAGERLTIDGLRSFYIEHRLEHLPSGGDFMTGIRQDEIIDVHTLIGQEFDAALADQTTRVLREAAEKLSNGAWPEGFFPGVSGAARELSARAQRESSAERWGNARRGCSGACHSHL